MAKKFVKVTQTWSTTVIMDIKNDESYDSIQNRINEHLEHNGGAETVICLGGEVKHTILKKTPKAKDEDSFECID